jgi:hypothetical protein
LLFAAIHTHTRPIHHAANFTHIIPSQQIVGVVVVVVVAWVVVFFFPSSPVYSDRG